MRRKTVRRILPNVLSGARVFLGLSFAALIGRYCSAPAESLGWLLFGLFLTILLTDLLDGALARLWHAESQAGAVLDVSADAVYIFSAYLVLNVQQILPVWFTAAVILKFLEFLLTSRTSKSSTETARHPFLFDRLGRIASAGYLILPGAVVLCLLLDKSFLIGPMILLLTLAALSSSLLRVGRTIFKNGLSEKTAP